MVNGKNAAYDGYPLLSVNHIYIHNKLHTHIYLLPRIEHSPQRLITR